MSTLMHFAPLPIKETTGNDSPCSTLPWMLPRMELTKRASPQLRGRAQPICVERPRLDRALDRRVARHPLLVHRWPPPPSPPYSSHPLRGDASMAPTQRLESPKRSELLSSPSHAACDLYHTSIENSHPSSARSIRAQPRPSARAKSALQEKRIRHQTIDPPIVATITMRGMSEHDARNAHRTVLGGSSDAHGPLRPSDCPAI
jgi:hypothetical protein